MFHAADSFVDSGQGGCIFTSHRRFSSEPSLQCMGAEVARSFLRRGDFVGADFGQWLWTSRLLTAVVSIHYWKLHSTAFLFTWRSCEQSTASDLKLLIKREAECWRGTFQQVETHLSLLPHQG